MSGKKCYYQILGLEKSAQIDQIKKSYKKLAMKWHPDKNPNDAEKAKEKFTEISEAYKVLSDPENKKAYDKYGHQGPKSSGFSGFDFHDANCVFENFFRSSGFDNDDDEKFFSAIFGKKDKNVSKGNSFGGYDGFGGFGGIGSFSIFQQLLLKTQLKVLERSEDKFSSFGSGGDATKSVSTVTQTVNGQTVTVKKTKVTNPDGSQETTQETIDGDKKMKKTQSLGAGEAIQGKKKSNNQNSIKNC